MLQPKSHTPLVHTGEPFLGAAQALPQLPQFDVSFFRSEQAPLQLVVPGGQEITHLPPEHTWLTAQAVWQSPQWAASDSRLAHTASQAVKPMLQATPHLPA